MTCPDTPRHVTGAAGTYRGYCRDMPQAENDCRGKAHGELNLNPEPNTWALPWHATTWRGTCRSMPGIYIIRLVRGTARDMWHHVPRHAAACRGSARGMSRAVAMRKSNIVDSWSMHFLGKYTLPNHSREYRYSTIRDRSFRTRCWYLALSQVLYAHPNIPRVPVYSRPHQRGFRL